MSPDQNPIWSTLDEFGRDVERCGARHAMQRLVGSLAAHRAGTTCERWKASCAGIESHPALAVLLEDPYSRDARLKPAGYAGDARTLDYVYLQDPGLPAPTSGGRALFDIATSVPIAAAVRNRSVWLARQIATRAEQGPLRVASIACGHARELDHVPAALLSRMTYWGLDQDAKSIRHCRRRFEPDGATFEAGSVRDVLTGRVRIPPSDLVYASGLFDYLEDRAAALLIRRMFAATRPGGSALVPNLRPDNEELGYMEAVMDWWMVYRSESDLRELAAAAGLSESDARVTTFSTSANRVAWLQVDRMIG